MSKGGGGREQRFRSQMGNPWGGGGPPGGGSQQPPWGSPPQPPPWGSPPQRRPDGSSIVPQIGELLGNLDYESLGLGGGGGSQQRLYARAPRRTSEDFWGNRPQWDPTSPEFQIPGRYGGAGAGLPTASRQGSVGMGGPSTDQLIQQLGETIGGYGQNQNLNRPGAGFQPLGMADGGIVGIYRSRGF